MQITKPTVLILCTGNSCRSHLAEGFLRAAAGNILDVQSAGSKPAGHVHPFAVKVMREVGIDISQHQSKHLDQFLHQKIETVITVCGKADEVCPVFPNQVNRHHWGFDDPAQAMGDEGEILIVFRRVRDEIRRVFDAYAAGRKMWGISGLNDRRKSGAQEIPFKVLRILLENPLPVPKCG